MSKNM